MPLWCNAWERRELESKSRFLLPCSLALSWADGWSHSDYSRFVELNGGAVVLTKKLFQLQRSSSLSCTYSHNRTCKICSVNKDVLLWLNTLLYWSANPKGSARQILPLLYRCAAWLCVSSHACRWGNPCPNIETSLFSSLWTQQPAVQKGIFSRAK